MKHEYFQIHLEAINNINNNNMFNSYSVITTVPENYNAQSWINTKLKATKSI